MGFDYTSTQPSCERFHYGKNASEARYDEWGEATRLLAKLKAAKLAADKKMLAMYEA